MSNPNQLYLLADHIKLSLLERRRAQNLHLDERENDTQNGHISRSLEQFRDGLAALSEEKARLEGEGDQSSAASSLADALPALQKQFDDLTAQFTGSATASSKQTLASPNSAALAEDFAHAASTSPASATTSPPHGRSPAADRQPLRPGGGVNLGARKPSKTVRFSDSPNDAAGGNGDDDDDVDPNHAALFGSRYRDNPEGGSGADGAYTDGDDPTAQMSGQQLHAYHNQVLQDQDEALDRLGESIGRQRELSMQIGDELDSHVVMLDEVDGLVDRHITKLDRAKRTLSSVSKTASENKQMTTIVVLIIVLVLLIAILK